MSATAAHGCKSGGNLISYNAINPSVYQKLGLDITNATTRTLLTSSITSPLAVAAGFTKPYANFPDTGTVIQSLRPFPQYNGIGSLWAPLGASWYNALQAKLTKRYSHGLTMTGAYAFSKTLDSFSGAGNIFDRSTFKSLSPNDRPHILSFSIDYTIPAFGFIGKNRIARTVLAGWTIGSISQYGSGPLLGAPGSNNSIGTYLPGQGTRQFRVPGVPLYLKNLNCGCIDPDAGDGSQSGGLGGSGSRRVWHRHGLLQRLPGPAAAGGIDEPGQEIPDSRDA